MAGFNDLPAEIRNIMYEKLLKGESLAQHRKFNELAMFTVSKQLHHESSSYFYQHNNIAVDAPSNATDTATVLPPIADRYLRFLKRLTVHTSVGQPTLPGTVKVAAAIAALSTAGVRLEELNLIISSPLSHLLNSRVDDSIMDSTHPITWAIRDVLRSGVTKTLRIQLENVWFAAGIAQALRTTFDSRLEFYINGTPAEDTSLLERALTGRYTSTHLTTLGLNYENISNNSCSNLSSPLSSPTSLASSLCSAFGDLETFSVSSYELSSDEDEAAEGKDEADEDEQPFFTEDDIEEWSASTQEAEEGQEDQELGAVDDTGDEEMEGVQQDDIEAIMQNLQEAAHHVANGDDVTYMTNFAPDLLLSRHQLGHLA